MGIPVHETRCIRRALLHHFHGVLTKSKRIKWIEFEKWDDERWGEGIVEILKTMRAFTVECDVRKTAERGSERENLLEKFLTTSFALRKQFECRRAKKRGKYHSGDEGTKFPPRRSVLSLQTAKPSRADGKAKGMMNRNKQRSKKNKKWQHSYVCSGKRKIKRAQNFNWTQHDAMRSSAGAIALMPRSSHFIQFSLLLRPFFSCADAQRERGHRRRSDAGLTRVCFRTKQISVFTIERY